MDEKYKSLDSIIPQARVRHSPYPGPPPWTYTMKHCLAVVLFLFATTSSNGQSILSNLPGTSSGAGTNLGLNSLDRVKAVGLTTDTQTRNFLSMSVMISNPDAFSNDLSGGIFSSSGGNPGTLLAAFDTLPVAAGTTDSVLTLSVTGGFTLNPLTSYWFVLDGPSTVNFLLWNSLNPNAAPVGAVGITFDGYRFSSDGGTVWGPSSVFNGVDISASLVAVPEPTTLALFGLSGAASIGWYLRRRSIQQRLNQVKLSVKR